MSHSFADDAIALLIDLAQRGEIDPWDVNVVEVFDRFLSELTLKSSQDLATSGQAFLYASMLILLKAESLAGLDPAEDLTEEPFEFLDEDIEFVTGTLPLNLERRLHSAARADCGCGRSPVPSGQNQEGCATDACPVCQSHFSALPRREHDRGGGRARANLSGYLYW
jgi:Segregation and condensation protein ScpA